MANASDAQEPWFFPYAGSRMHFTPAAFSSSYAQNLYGFRRFQGLYATSGSINHLPPMESFHFRTNELGHAYRVMATATSDLDAQYRTCFENLDTQLELISSFPERVFEYLQSLSTQVVKALEAFQDLTQALYATGARLPVGIQPLRGRASQAAEYLASEFSTGAAATNFLNSLTMYNAAQFRQSLNLSQELTSAWATA